MNSVLPECPIASAAVLVADKWKIQIMREMLLDAQTPKHFSDFKKNILHISDKMLSKSLKDLEADHIIMREIEDSKPPRNVYRLTDIGFELGDVLEALDAWGQRYYQMYSEEIEERRK